MSGEKNFLRVFKNINEKTCSIMIYSFDEEKCFTKILYYAISTFSYDKLLKALDLNCILIYGSKLIKCNDNGCYQFKKSISNNSILYFLSGFLLK
jgi:hypothetical protein